MNQSRLFLKSAILLVFGCLTLSVGAQTNHLRAEQFTTNDGLTSNIISAVIQDDLGYLWMRTEYGIARFDGYTFDSYDYDPNNPGTPFQKVNVHEGLFLDQRGSIWLDYDGNGLSYLDYATGLFHHFKPDDTKKDYIGNYDVYSYQALSKDEVLIGTGGGLFKYDYISGDFSRIKAVGDLPVRCMLVDNVGNLWFGTGYLSNYLNGQGLFLYETTTSKLHQIGVGTERVNQIFQDSKGRIWLATNQGIGRVQGYSPGTTKDFTDTYYEVQNKHFGDGLDPRRNNFEGIGEFENNLWAWGNLGLARVTNVTGRDFAFKMYMTEGELDNNSAITFMTCLQDQAGDLWAISNNPNYGLVRYDPVRDKFEKNLEKHGAMEWDEGRLLAAFIGRDNVLWLGTERYGLLKIDIEQKQFNTLRIHQDLKQVSNNIYSITEGAEKTLWVGTANGVAHYYPDTESFEHFNNRNSQMNGNVVFCTYLDSRGLLWMGHNPDQVSRIDLKTWTNYPFRYVIDADTTGFYAWAISAIREDDRADIWVASHSGGIYQCIKGERDFRNYLFKKEGQVFRLTVNTIEFDQEQTLWAGTTFGLYYLNKQTDQLEELVAYENAKPFKEAITVINEHPEGFWIGTQSGGLVKLDLETRSVKRFTTEHGLPGNTVNAILKENDHILWISTNNGLSRYDIKKNQFSNYSTDDGLPSNNFNMNAAYKDHNGHMYFGSIDGIVHFNPDQIKPNPFASSPIITGIQLFNKEVLVGDSINNQVVLHQPASRAAEITLNHRNNILTFNFSSMHYASPNNNMYAYKLDNLEEDWNYVEASRRNAAYTSLPSGKYIFRVKATNSDGVWGKDEATLEIIMLPPWWHTNWFRFILLALLLLLTYALFRLRTRNIKARNITLKKLVTEKTAGLEMQNRKIQEMADRLHNADQSKLKFFMNISHEFRTPLTLILGPVANLMRSPRLTRTEKEDVRLIERNGHRLLRLTNQLMDSSDLDRDTLKLKVAKSDIVAFIKEIAAAFDFRADNMDIDYQFVTNQPSEVGWFDGDKIEKILYNLISNALKFTNVRGKIRVIATIQDQTLQVEVIDNGIGIKQSKLDRIFERFYQVEESDRRRMGTGIGLNLAKKLAEKHKGTLTATSKVGEGTQFVLTIPIGVSSYTADEKALEQVSVTERAWQIQKLFAAESKTDTDPVIRKAEMGIVLLIEDSVDMRAYLKNGLKSHFSVIEATNGAEGLKLAEEMVPDLIVSDVMMPKMDGMEFCLRIKENDLLNHIPVILLTAKVGEQNQMEGYQVGADDYLAKPIDLNLLRVRINNLIKSRSELRDYFTSTADLVPDKLASNHKDQVFLEKAVRIVEQNLGDSKLNYQQFVEELGISKTRLYDKINKLSGLSINLFIRSVRLKIAARMIKEGTNSISEIAYKVGFSDPGYFSKCFKQQFGIPPKEYANQQSSQLTIDN